MDTLELLYQLARNQSSIQDARDLLIATGHDEAVVNESISTLIADRNTDVRWTGAAFPRNANIFIVPRS